MRRQLSGVEGYTESIASGMLAGIYAASLANGKAPTPAPRLSANGSLTHYITHSETKKFQPANITFDLLPPLEEDLRKKMRDKKERHKLQCERALDAWSEWLAANHDSAKGLWLKIAKAGSGNDSVTYADPNTHANSDAFASADFFGCHKPGGNFDQVRRDESIQRRGLCSARHDRNCGHFGTHDAGA